MSSTDSTLRLNVWGSSVLRDTEAVLDENLSTANRCVQRLDFPSDPVALKRSKVVPALQVMFGALFFDPSSSRSTESLSYRNGPLQVLSASVLESQGSVSSRLIAPREEILAHSLLAPSGAYMSWIELTEDADDGGEAEIF